MDPAQSQYSPGSSTMSSHQSRTPALAAAVPAIPTTKSDVDALLRKKRKIREPRACYPCRQRKVKCDSQTPCKTCRERGHAAICSFTPPNKRRDTGDDYLLGMDAGVNGNGTQGGTYSEEREQYAAVAPASKLVISGEDWERLCNKLNTMEQTIFELKSDLHSVIRPLSSGTAALQALNESSTVISPEAHARSGVNGESDRPEATGPKLVKAMEINEQSHFTGETVHLGGGSVPALVMALQKSNGLSGPAMKDVLGSGVLDLFGLDNENATYPFVSLWGSSAGTTTRVSELSKAIPNDAECLELLRAYTDGARVTYPAVVEIEKFESDVLSFLGSRRIGIPEHESSVDNDDFIFGKTLQWIGLLFSVFASGAQFCSRPRAERDLISQVYGCCSFECLRLVNYLSNVSLENVQTMLILGNVLSNGMNPGASWAFLGMTLRLAQALGIHRSSERANPSQLDIARSRTWWAVVWQDSLLSQAYDRPSSALIADCPFPPQERTSNGGLSYVDAMYRIRKVGLDTLRNRITPQSVAGRLVRCVDLREEVTRTTSAVCAHLKDYKLCTSDRQRAEYWQLFLHSSYMNSELCRPAISPSMAEYDKSGDLRRVCVAELMHAVEAYLGIARDSAVHLRSWSITHRGLSCALLLGILGEPSRNAKAQKLLMDMIEVLRGDGAFNKRDGAAESRLSAPILRSIRALHKLSATGTRTPRPMEENTSASGQQASTYSATLSPPHADMKLRPNSIDDLVAGTASIHSGEELMDTFGSGTLPTMAMNFDDTNFYIPSPLSGFEDDSSPHALMNSIIFGRGNEMMSM